MRVDVLNIELRLCAPHINDWGLFFQFLMELVGKINVVEGYANVVAEDALRVALSPLSLASKHIAHFGKSMKAIEVAKAADVCAVVSKYAVEE